MDLSIKIMCTCFVIWIVQMCIVGITHDESKKMLPDWFYISVAVNAIVGCVLFVGCILYVIWI